MRLNPKRRGPPTGAVGPRGQGRHGAPALEVEYVQVGSAADALRARQAVHRIMREAWERADRRSSAP